MNEKEFSITMVPNVYTTSATGDAYATTTFADTYTSVATGDAYEVEMTES